MSTPVPTIAELISRGPQAVRDAVPAFGNLLGLAQSAAMRARAQLNPDWLHAAVEAYEALAQRERGRSAATSLADSALLRAYFIAHAGVADDDELRQITPLITWFNSVTTLSPEEAEARAARRDLLDPSQRLELRDIKNRLAVFAVLAPRGLLDQFPEILRWLSLRPKLP
jgi:hypothetical protein